MHYARLNIAFKFQCSIVECKFCLPDVLITRASHMNGSETNGQLNTPNTTWLFRRAVHPQHFASTVIDVLVLKVTVTTESRIRLPDKRTRSYFLVAVVHVCIYKLRILSRLFCGDRQHSSSTSSTHVSSSLQVCIGKENSRFPYFP